MLLNDRYELHERIGEGGMALVYRATDRRLGRQVALKMLRPQYASDADFLARFEHEARSAARLQHPNIASVFDTGVDQGHHYIVMELLKPFTLKDLIAHSGGRLPVEHAARFAGEIAGALAHAHKHGVVHRDIKPQNILFTDDGHVKVSDFGIARALAGGSSTATGTILGSPHYISPEQARGEAAGPASDLYSLGVVLYEMLTGAPPFHGETAVAVAVQHLRATPPAVSALLPEVPEAVSMVVARTMAKEPAQRFASAVDLAAALQAALAGRMPELAATTVLPRAEPDRPRPEVHVPGERPERRGLAPSVIALVVVVMVLGTGFGMWLAGREGGAGSGTEPAAGGAEQRQAIEVPDLIGRDVNAERNRLEQYYAQLGLEPPQIVEVGEEDSREPADRVLRQEPPPGASILEGDVVRVWLSSGVEKVEVPDVVGMTLERADRALTDAGLFRANQTYEYSELMVPDVVVRQSQPPGSKVRAQTGIDVVLSRGPKPTEPAEPPAEPTEPPAEIEPSVAVSSPEPLGDGTLMSRVTVSLPAGAEAAEVELRWLSGGDGTAGGGSLDPGAIFEQEVTGEAGSLLGVFVNGRELKQVQF